MSYKHLIIRLRGLFSVNTHFHGLIPTISQQSHVIGLSYYAASMSSINHCMLCHLRSISALMYPCSRWVHRSEFPSENPRKAWTSLMGILLSGNPNGLTFGGSILDMAPQRTCVLTLYWMIWESLVEQDRTFNGVLCQLSQSASYDLRGILKWQWCWTVMSLFMPDGHSGLRIYFIYLLAAIRISHMSIGACCIDPLFCFTRRKLN